MKQFPEALNLRQVKVYPLAERQSLSALDQILVDPGQPPRACDAAALATIHECAANIAAARQRGASVILMYGAHLIKNGAMGIVNRLMERGWVTHLATNGAGTIHDWELAFLGRTEESVRQNVATGTFGTWDETGRCIHLALLAGALQNEGYGRSLGRFICEDGVTLPATGLLEKSLRDQPADPLAPARAELLQAMLTHRLPAGRIAVQASVEGDFDPRRRHFVTTFRSPSTPASATTSSPTIPCSTAPPLAARRPWTSGCSAARWKAWTGASCLSVGSAIMAPQVFEKSISCVNNLRLQAGRKIVHGHTIYVVDIQDGGKWDWSQGEPPKDNPAYYLRFCKSFSRMGGRMNYVQCDNVAFLHNLLNLLAV